MTQLSLEYLAGLLDGEGTITLTKERSNSILRRPVVSIQMCEEGLIRRLADSFGGAVTQRRAKKSGHSPAFTWNLTNGRAVSLLARVLPHLQIVNKKRRAEMIVQDIAPLIKKNGQYTPEDIETRRALEQQFFLLTPSRMSPI